MQKVEQIEGTAPEQFTRRKFDDLTPIDPHERIILEPAAEPLTMRVMDLLTPIGKGRPVSLWPRRVPARRFCCSTSPRRWPRIIPKCTS